MAAAVGTVEGGHMRADAFADGYGRAAARRAGGVNRALQLDVQPNDRGAFMARPRTGCDREKPVVGRDELAAGNRALRIFPRHQRCRAAEGCKVAWCAW